MIAWIIVAIVIVVMVSVLGAMVYAKTQIDQTEVPSDTTAPSSGAAPTTGGTYITDARTTTASNVTTAQVMPAVLAMRRLAPGIDTAPTMTDTALRAFVTRETAPKFPTLDEARLAYGRLMMDARAAGQNTTAIDTELKRAQVIIKHAQGINQLLSQGYVCGMSVDEATRYFPDCKIEKVTKKGASCPAGTVAYTTDGLRDPPPVAAGNTYCHPATSSGRRPKYMFIGPPYTTGGGFVPTTLQYYMSYL